MSESPYVSPFRNYRGRCRPREGEFAFQVVNEQTDLWIVADGDLSEQVQQVVHTLRAQLKACITLNPAFRHSLTPVPVNSDAAPLLRDMAEAARRCGVGPMAAVAGALAEHVCRAVVAHSPNLLVENGGDLFLHSARARVVGLLADPAAGATLGLQLEAADFPLSLCASSASIGHSLSLGQGDLVVVRARSGSFADAAATALCNRLHDAQSIEHVLDCAKELARPVRDAWPGHRLDGVLAQCQGRLGVWGKMELVML